ncbi:hypothetical protein [Amycolatopsis lurida]|uniref:hypothetical protein n=1 Tax=Amycolatopsis lurida TaxID=31959 RepID=UPI003652B5D3
MAAIGAPLLARRVRPGYVVAATLVLLLLLALTEVEHQAIAADYTMSGAPLCVVSSATGADDGRDLGSRPSSSSRQGRESGNPLPDCRL